MAGQRSQILQKIRPAFSRAASSPGRGTDEGQIVMKTGVPSPLSPRKSDEEILRRGPCHISLLALATGRRMRSTQADAWETQTDQ